MFTTRLVVPLLETMHSLSSAQTTAYLCLQIRCAASHALLMQKAPEYFEVTDMSSSLHSLPGCGNVAKAMECHLIRLQHRST